MAYSPQTWSDGQVGATPLSAARLTHMEEGIEAAATAADSALEATAALAVSVIEAESTIGNPISLLDQTFPERAIGFRLNIIMPGNGGGSGRKGAPSTVRNGGAAGSGAGMTVGLFVPKPVGAHRWHANIPSPGLGGAAVTANSTSGNSAIPPQGGQNGGAYGRVWITDEGGAVLWQHYLYPGAVAPGGTNAAMAAVGGGFGLGFNGTSSSAPGNGVAGPTSGPNGSAPCAGGPGGSISNTNTPFNGSPGGWCTCTNVSVPTGGVVGGALPTSGNGTPLNPPKYAGMPGNGGSGGAASTTGNAQDGADGVGYGAGGGGGGAGTDGVGNSGKGGNGGPGWLSVEMVYA